jgi:type II secretory pathway pseudopilin PulG
VLIADAARSESGFTLVEVLVAMVMGVIVIGATMAILTVALHQNVLLNDRVQANQASRTTMTKIVNALHSACLSPGFTPVQEKSTGSKLIFVNAYSSIAAIPSASESVSEGAYRHELEYVSATGKLVDKSYPSTSVASWPEIAFSGTASKTRVLGDHISQTGATPVFQYYKYAEKSAESASTGLGTLAPLLSKPATEEVNKTTAKEVASVLVSFNTKPKDNDTRTSRSVNLSSQVTFAFSAPAAETPVQGAPCE